MVKHCTPSRLDAIFAALSDPTRRRMLEMLARAECRVSELAAPFPISLPAISKHLSVLEGAGLIRRQRDGRHQNVRLQAKRLREAAEWIARHRAFWEGRLDALAAFLESPKSKQRKPKPSTE
jgi:DNA-binding transcriptional ArsR family regulator